MCIRHLTIRSAALVPFAAKMLANKSVSMRSAVRGQVSRRSVRVEAAAYRRSWAPGVAAPAHLTGE